MSPLSAHGRVFRLYVMEVDADVLSEDSRHDLLEAHKLLAEGESIGDSDVVEIVYGGKVFPSTQDRIQDAITNGYVFQTERRLA